MVLEQVNKKAVVAAGTKGAIQEKELKGMGIILRLQALSARGVLAVAEALSNLLREVKMKERDAAKTDLLKAAAQRRIILPNTQGRTIRSLVHWLYGQGALDYEDPEHL